MNIGIDGRLLVKNQIRGIGRGLFESLPFFIKYSNYQFYFYFDKEPNVEIRSILNKYGYTIKIIRCNNHFFWEQILLPINLFKSKINLFWHTSNTASFYLPVKRILTIHDIIFVKKFYRFYSPIFFLKSMYFTFILFNSINKVSKIITVSEYSKKDILNHFINTKSSNIQVVYNGLTKNSFISNNSNSGLFYDFLNQYNLNSGFFLTLGADDPRKNTYFVIKSFFLFLDNYKNTDIKLIISGFKDFNKSKIYRFVQNSQYKDNVIFLDYISNHILSNLYKNAITFLFLSLYEGFGLPILEAMSFGCPVITTKMTSIPEVAGNAVLYSSHDNVNQLSIDINSVFIDKNKRLELRNLGYNQIKKFTWEKFVDNIINEINSILY
jgi:glycosyltransferase involved in cell wall biosynthesis